MLRWPARSRRSFIHCGVGAPALTLRITRPAKRPQPSGALMRTGCLAFVLPAIFSIFGTSRRAPVNAETSRATPRIERQSARFGVSLSVMIRSSSPSTPRTSLPTLASFGSSSSPEWSFDSPSSRAEASMP